MPASLRRLTQLQILRRARAKADNALPRITHKALAKMIGKTPVHVSRLFTKLDKKEQIHMQASTEILLLQFIDKP